MTDTHDRVKKSGFCFKYKKEFYLKKISVFYIFDWSYPFCIPVGLDLLMPRSAAVIFFICFCRRFGISINGGLPGCTGLYRKEAVYWIFPSFADRCLVIHAIITRWHVGKQHPGKMCCPKLRINFSLTLEFLYVSWRIFHQKYWTIICLISM